MSFSHAINSSIWKQSPPWHPAFLILFVQGLGQTYFQMVLFETYRVHVSLSGSQATVFITRLFNYITQGYIRVWALHIFKGISEGLHISLHLLEKKVKGKWTVSRMVYLEGLTALQDKKFGYNSMKFDPKIQAQSPKACSCRCSLPDYVYIVILYTVSVISCTVLNLFLCLSIT